MEKDSIPVAPIGAYTKLLTRSTWTRSLVELNGKPGRNYVRRVSPLLLNSYAEIGAFPHQYDASDRSVCRTYTRQFDYSDMLHMFFSSSASDYINFRQSQDPDVFHRVQNSLFKVGVSALEFDSTGNFLASVTRSGCLSVHKFETLYTNESEQREYEQKQLAHISLYDNHSSSPSINAVRWNPSNEDEIAFTSWKNKEVCIYGIFSPHQPCQILKRDAARTYDNLHLYDIAFLKGDTRVLACDTWGLITMWDRRVSSLPQIRLATFTNNGMAIGLTSIQLLGDQYVYGASKNGFIHIWDLRRVRSSSTVRSDEVFSLPLTSVNLASMLNTTGKAQSNTRPREIHAINMNPSCPYQLGFHLADGCSGVLDMHNFQVSHIHCPDPSPWLAEAFKSPPRKPSWIPKHSIYVAPSTSSNGLHLLDFYPHPSSACHVDYDDSKIMGKSTVERQQNVFVPLSKRITACAIHPLNDTIVAGTMEASLLVISQKHHSKKGDGDDDEQS